LFIEIFTRGGERSVVKGKEEVSWFKPQLHEHASSTMPTDVLLDFCSETFVGLQRASCLRKRLEWKKP